jgi:hypothetical protein
MQNYIPIENDIKFYPEIGSKASEQQMMFHRKDPDPYTKFYHVLEEERAAHVRKEILQSLIAIGSLALIIWVVCHG